MSLHTKEPLNLNALADTFAIAGILVNDEHDLIQKANGGWLRHAGRHKHRHLLLALLDKHTATMPRTVLRYAIEHLSPKAKKHYLNPKAKTAIKNNIS